MHDRNEFYTSFMALDGAIDRLIASLPPVDRAATPDVVLTSLVTHTLARVATIQLRSSFKDYDRMNDRKDFTAAQAAVALLDQFNIASANVDPILAVRHPHPSPVTRPRAERDNHLTDSLDGCVPSADW